MSRSLSQREILERELLSRPVGSLQYMLRKLSEDYDFLPDLVVDGVFGARTLEAVMGFQRAFALPVTGTADQATWNAIREEWLALEARSGPARPVRAFPAEGTKVDEGMDKAYMILPQTMFRVLSRQLDGIVPDRADGMHGQASADNVRWLQRAAGQPQTGCMDQMAWDALSRLYEIFVVEDPEGQAGYRGGWG